MSEEQQPEAVWAFPEKKNNKRRIWLIVILSVVAVAIVAALLFFFLPRGGEPEATPSPTTSESATPTPTATPEPTPTAPDDPTTPPPAPDPDLDTFAAQVQPRLDDASTGLQMVAGMSGQEAVQVVDQLQQDATRLSDSAAPSAIAEKWVTVVSDYGTKLSTLRTAYENGSAPKAALDAATAALKEVRALVGL